MVTGAEVYNMYMAVDHHVRGEQREAALLLMLTNDAVNVVRQVRACVCV